MGLNCPIFHNRFTNESQIDYLRKFIKKKILWDTAQYKMLRILDYQKRL